MKKLLYFGATVLAAVLIWHFSRPVQTYVENLPVSWENLASSSLPSQLQNLGEQIFAPPPLRGGENAGADLTDAGVIAQTNLQRQQNGGLAELAENAKLDLDAKNKLDDMFKQQYFEHVNPQGLGPADQAKAVGYAYISIGENLALGSFDGDAGLVTAWMNSPGHRANILNVKFMEIGVAVGKGLYQGHTEWLAVQEFGKPASSCPVIDASLKAEIDSLNSDVKQMQTQLAAQKSAIDSANPQTRQEYDAYNSAVQQYNDLVHIYNNKVDQLKQDTSQYNAEVQAYNACAAG